MQKLKLPPTPQVFRLPGAALGLLVATVILALLIGVSTYRNLDHSRNMIEDFLVKKGETIIRSLEAGNRTSMMHHHMGNGNPLHTLIIEHIRENDIAFILIMDEHGNITDQTEPPGAFHLSPEEIDAIVNSGAPVTAMHQKQAIFTVSKLFHISGRKMTDRNMMMPWGRSEPTTRIITIGLLTKEFDLARKRDVQHALLMGAILFLVGCAGLYVLFFYQEVRLARSNLADLKIYADNVIESMPAGLITFDARDRVISCNSKAEEILGRSLNDMYGSEISDVFSGCAIDCSAMRADGVEQAVECLTAEGRSIPVKISGSSLVNEEGEQTGTVLIIKDMSTIKEMEQQLERSRHMALLGKMAASIAHEIRNPLGTLRGFAHYFGVLPEIDKKSKSYAELMKSEVDRLNRTVSGLLQFARPRDPHRAEISLDALFSKTVALTEGDCKAHGLNFHYQCNTDIRVEADPDLLLQVLMNILQNSVAATVSGGEISLAATENEHQVRIRVTDTGCGMTEEERRKMFDPFFTTRKNGTGLGLAVSHQIIEQHNGSLEVETGPGQGTAITIVLPKTKRRTSAGRAI